MSWETKTDYCGLTGTNIPLEVKTASLNNSGQYLEKHGSDGAFVAAGCKAFGERAAPSNTYTITGALTVSGKSLGAVTSVGGVKYALESISWTTGADAEPTLSATAKQVESGASITTSSNNRFILPTFGISSAHVAQIPEFTSGGTTVAAFDMPTADNANADCELLECGGEISCTVKTNDKNGDPQWHDVTSGHIVINITIAQYGNTIPTVSPGNGWNVSSPLTSDDPDSDMPTWKMTLSRSLSKTFRTAS